MPRRPADVQPRTARCASPRERAAAERALAYWIRDLRYGEAAPWQAFPVGDRRVSASQPGHEYRLRIQPVAVYRRKRHATGSTRMRGQVKYRLRETALGRGEGVRRAAGIDFPERGGAAAKTGRNRVGKTSLRRPCQSQTGPDGARQPQTVPESPLPPPTGAGLRTKGCAT